jgi:hypothetical protein
MSSYPGLTMDASWSGQRRCLRRAVEILHLQTGPNICATRNAEHCESDKLTRARSLLSFPSTFPSLFLFFFFFFPSLLLSRAHRSRLCSSERFATKRRRDGRHTSRVSTGVEKRAKGRHARRTHRKNRKGGKYCLHLQGKNERVPNERKLMHAYKRGGNGAAPERKQCGCSAARTTNRAKCGPRQMYRGVGSGLPAQSAVAPKTWDHFFNQKLA